MAMDRTEQIGLGSAAAGHALLILMLSLGLFSASEPLLRPEPVTVTLVEDSAPEATTTEASDENPPPPAEIESQVEQQAAPLPDSAPEPPAPPVAQIIPKPVVQPVTPPVTRPVPKPVKAVQPVPKPKPTPTKTALSKPAPAKPAAVKPAPAKPKTVAAKPVAARPAPAKTASKTTTTPRKSGGFGSGFEERISGLGRGATSTGSTKAGGSGASKTASAPPGKPAAEVRRSVTAALASQIRPYLEACAPSGVDIDAIRTFITLNLASNGVLSSASFNKQTGINESNRPQAEPLKQCALRAARQASPYRGLDPAYHDVWKSHAMQLKAN
jgi:periplasmic protein TonB